MKEDELFPEGMKALSTIYLHVIEIMQREIEALRHMLLERNVTEQALDDELAQRVEDHELQARVRQIMDQEHVHTLENLINQIRTSAEFMELLRKLKGPTN